MKLTKSALIEIIAEELAVEAESPEAGGDESGKELKSDVKTIVKKLKGYIEKIDTYQEYGQLLSYILKHPVKGKRLAHAKLKPLFIAGMKEQ